MQQHVQRVRDMQVAQLQCSAQRNHHGCVYFAQAALSVRLIFCAPLVILLHDARWKGLSGNAAGKRGIVVDVEFEEVEERVVDEVDGAVDFLIDAEVQLQWPTGLIAGECGNVCQLTGCGIGDVLACVATSGNEELLVCYFS